jgi:hypothetical protein
MIIRRRFLLASSLVGHSCGPATAVPGPPSPLRWQAFRACRDEVCWPEPSSRSLRPLALAVPLWVHFSIKMVATRYPVRIDQPSDRHPKFRSRLRVDTKLTFTAALTS